MVENKRWDERANWWGKREAMGKSGRREMEVTLGKEIGREKSKRAARKKKVKLGKMVNKISPLLLLVRKN